jgi:hypothetical protein
MIKLKSLGNKDTTLSNPYGIIYKFGALRHQKKYEDRNQDWQGTIKNKQSPGLVYHVKKRNGKSPIKIDDDVSKQWQ